MTYPDNAPELGALREAIMEEYDAVACDPGRGFHFHTGRFLARRVGYEAEWLDGMPEAAIESFAGTGNPFMLGPLRSGEKVVDIGSGAGIDSLIASNMVGPDGFVVGVDMTQSMLDRATSAAAEGGFGNVEFRKGFGEELPVADGWADVVISNGVLNLMPDKGLALAEMTRILGPNGRLQIGDIMVSKEVPENAKERIDLWTG
jgi:SAM-dependent methyltransferase